jgi:osmotically-inducible protein OsmY
MMRSDSDIKRDVEDELRWDPDLDATDIAVTVKNGVVTLAGFTRSYADKLEAEAAAKRVAGVLGVANDIEVRLPALDQRPDPEIARDAIAAIKSRLPLVAEQIKVVVRNGWISLEGEVEWDYQRSAAESAVRRVKRLKGLPIQYWSNRASRSARSSARSRRLSAAARKSMQIGSPSKLMRAR